MNFAPIVAAVVLLGASLAGFSGYDVLPGEQTELVTNITAIATGVAGALATLKAIRDRRNAPPAPPAE